MVYNEKLSSVQKAMKKSDIKLCLYPDLKNHSKLIIKAHSIQSKKIIERICDAKGQVLIPDIKIFGSKSGFNLKNVGKGLASTFNGLCSYHDNILFKSIEDNDYKNTKEQDVYYALRSIIKELYTKKKVIKFLNPFVEENDARLFQLGNIKGEYDLTYYLKMFYSNISVKKFDFLETKRIIFNDEYLIALNSSINLTKDFNGKAIDCLEDFKRIPKALFINIFPQKGKTYILLSYLSKDRNHFRFLDEQLINQKEKNQKIRLTNLISLNVENLVISPKLWGNFSKNEKEAYQKLFLEQIAWKQPNPSLIKVYNAFNWFKEAR